MKTPADERPVLGTIAKSGMVLDLFTRDRPEWGVSEVARSLGMPKSGAHSQLSALTQIGVLRRTATNRYRLGWRLISLTHALLDSVGFRQQVREELVKLVRCAGDQVAAHLSVIDGADIIPVDRVASDDAPATYLTPPGRRLPAHSTAGGKLLMAMGSTAEPEAIERLDLQQLTPATIVDHDQLFSTLAKIREEGLAWDIEETFEGVSAVAAPIRDRDGSVIASVSVLGPSPLLAPALRACERLVSGSGRRMSEQVRGHYLGDHLDKTSYDRTSGTESGSPVLVA
jgi:DNA-binding IclR family transcriptional regulator